MGYSFTTEYIQSTSGNFSVYVNAYLVQIAQWQSL